jgi:hypothetical protein
MGIVFAYDWGHNSEKCEPVIHILYIEAKHNNEAYPTIYYIGEAKMIDAFLRWWLHGARYSWSKFRRRVFEQKYLKTQLPAVNSLKEIGDCLKQITWTMDNIFALFDSISYPQRTWATKKDDCDGFATVASALINSWNPSFEPVMITVITRPVSRSHTVCAFKYEGNIRFFNNSSLDGDLLNSYQDVVNKIHHAEDRLVCWDVRDPQTFEMK